VSVRKQTIFAKQILFWMKFSFSFYELMLGYQPIRKKWKDRQKNSGSISMCFLRDTIYTRGFLPVNKPVFTLVFPMFMTAFIIKRGVTFFGEP